MNYNERITLKGLPQGENPRLNPDKSYIFDFGYPSYVSTDEKRVLHIPELPARDAEGRPLCPEQAEWIEAMIQQKGLQMKDIWWSHWTFETDEDYEKFKTLLVN